jgi:hypothetical protein
VRKTSSTKATFAIGAAVAVLVLLALPTAVWLATSDLVWAVRSAVAVVVGALAIFGAALSSTPSRRVAHQACAECRRTILLEHDGEFCDVCSAAVHASCMVPHKASAHAVGPFR